MTTLAHAVAALADHIGITDPDSVRERGVRLNGPSMSRSAVNARAYRARQKAKRGAALSVPTASMHETTDPSSDPGAAPSVG